MERPASEGDAHERGRARTFGRERTARDRVARDSLGAQPAGHVPGQLVKSRLRRTLSDCSVSASCKLPWTRHTSRSRGPERRYPRRTRSEARSVVRPFNRGKIQTLMMRAGSRCAPPSVPPALAAARRRGRQRWVSVKTRCTFSVMTFVHAESGNSSIGAPHVAPALLKRCQCRDGGFDAGRGMGAL
jgi:hypothetical protein